MHRYLLRCNHNPLLSRTPPRQLVKDDPSALVLYVNAKPRLFATPERSEFIRLLTAHLTRLGLTGVIGDASVAISTAEFRTERLAHVNDNAARIAEFEVLKVRTGWLLSCVKLLVSYSSR